MDVQNTTLGITIPQACAVDMKRVKREATELERWTGLKSSEAQEITAEAIGAVNWQALCEQTHFVPDEALPFASRNDSLSWLGRYMRMALLLQERLNVGYAMAAEIALLWQPTALRPRLYQADWAYARHPSFVLGRSYGTHPCMPPGCALARAEMLGKPGDQYLVVVRADREASLMPQEDCIVVEPEQQGLALRALASDEHRDPEVLDALVTSVLEMPYTPFRLHDQQLETLLKPVQPCRLKAPWLKSGQTEEDVLQWTTQNEMRLQPDPREDCPDPEEVPGCFYSMTQGNLRYLALFVGDAVRLSAYRKDGTRFILLGSVHAGVGTIQFRMEPGQEAGFYLVEGRTRRKGCLLPGVTAAMAQELCLRLGIAFVGSDGRMAAPFLRHDFFASDVGLAFALALVRWPEERKNLREDRPYWPYLGDWYFRTLRRLRFEWVLRSTREKTNAGVSQPA
jgi:hypothetical protein